MNKSNWRWYLCALLFFATTVNYLDRQVLSLTWKDFIAPEFHWSNSDYGTITAAFSIFYAFVSLFAGKFIDWVGTRRGYLIAIFVWSLGACLHASCGWLTMHIHGLESLEAMRLVESGSAMALAISSTSVWLFMACRVILAVGESGNFPAAIKVTTEYFPWEPLSLPSRFRSWPEPTAGNGLSSSSVPSASYGWASGARCTRSRRRVAT